MTPEVATSPGECKTVILVPAACKHRFIKCQYSPCSFLLNFKLVPTKWLKNSIQSLLRTFCKLDIKFQVAHSTCEGTLYPDLCVSTLASFPDLTSTFVPQMISSIINHTIHDVKLSSSNCSGLKNSILRSINQLEQRVVDDCLNLFDDTILELRTTIVDLSQTTIGSKQYHNL